MLPFTDASLMPLSNKGNESEKTTTAGAVLILKESAFRQALKCLPLQDIGGGGVWSHLGFPILLLLRVTYSKEFLTGLLTFLLLPALPTHCPHCHLKGLSET